MQACSVPDCKDTFRMRRGLCNKHYLKLRRRGDPQIELRPASSDSILVSLAKRLELKSSGCIEWVGHKHCQGYGRLMHQGKMWLAHRLVYTLLLGDIPQGLELLHSCDNPACCNVNHLRPGTHLDNMRDASEKQRWQKLKAERLRVGTTTKHLKS